MDLSPCQRRKTLLAFSILILSVALAPAFAQSGSLDKHLWMNPSLSADERATLVVKQMTIDEKVSLLHGTGMKDLSPISPLAVHSNGGAGYLVGIPRLQLPPIPLSDPASAFPSTRQTHPPSPPLSL